jgi:hypothetical protein
MPLTQASVTVISEPRASELAQSSAVAAIDAMLIFIVFSAWGERETAHVATDAAAPQCCK